MLKRIFQILLGLIFLIGGVNGYVYLAGMEPFMPTSPEAIELLGDGYLMFMLKTLELVSGILLIIRRFVPLALLLLLPLVVNIVAFHLFIDPALLPMASLLIIFEGYLLWTERDHYKPLLVAR